MHIINDHRINTLGVETHRQYSVYTQTIAQHFILGQEYIQEVKNQSGVVGYYCSLCGCQFDSKLIILHSRGRRHKDQYQVGHDVES